MRMLYTPTSPARLGNIPTSLDTNIPGVLKDSGMGQTSLWSDLMTQAGNLYAQVTTAKTQQAIAQSQAATVTAQQQAAQTAAAMQARTATAPTAGVSTTTLLIIAAVVLGGGMMLRRGRSH